MSSPVLVEHVDSVAVVTINRPSARNAVDNAVTVALAEAMDELDADDSLAIGILTGAGGTFCAGMDLKAFLRGESVAVEGRGFGGLCERPPRKPLIAAVEGWALAGGFELALACDLIVAAEDAKFGIPEAKRSLVAGAGGLLRLPRVLPLPIAMELALTGDPLPAPEAHRYGLVNHLTPSGGALAGAKELAARIALNGPLAIAASKRILNSALDWSLEEGFRNQLPIMGPVLASADAREGATAFAEKRAPVWQGR